MEYLLIASGVLVLSIGLMFFYRYMTSLDRLAKVIQCKVAGKRPEEGVVIAKQLAPGYNVSWQSLEDGVAPGYSSDQRNYVILGVRKSSGIVNQVLVSKGAGTGMSASACGHHYKKRGNTL